jgi:hypothetical protein
LSPILVRPVREQLEHERVIRLLQARLKRKHEVIVNPGDEQTAGIRIGPGQMFPDLVLMSTDKARRIEGIIEVETGESVNHLEAMAQWAHFGRARIPFYLYVPASAIDMARRLCIENQVTVTEIWSFHTVGDQTRFTMVQRLAPQPQAPAAPRNAPAAKTRTEPSARKPKARPAPPPRKSARAAKPAAAKSKRSEKRK